MNGCHRKPPSLGWYIKKGVWVLTTAEDIPSELDPLLREALAWVIRLNSGTATTDDAAALALWRAQSPEHEAAFGEAVRLWRDLGQATRELLGAAGRSPVAVPE